MIALANELLLIEADAVRSLLRTIFDTHAQHDMEMVSGENYLAKFKSPLNLVVFILNGLHL